MSHRDKRAEPRWWRVLKEESRKTARQLDIHYPSVSAATNARVHAATEARLGERFRQLVEDERRDYE